MGQLIYNNYSKEFAPKSLKKGEVARFRAIGSDKMLQTLLQLPYEDYIEDHETGMMISIGCVKRLRAEGKPEFYFLHLNEIQQKCWVLLGGNKEHNEIYKFLQRCNFNRSNKFRDDALAPLIEEYDTSSEVRIKKEKLDQELAALVTARDMTDNEVRDHFGGDTVSDIDSLRIRLSDSAKKSPNVFVAEKEAKKELSNDDIKSLTQKAAGKNIIKFDSEMNEWYDMDGNLLVRCEKGVGHGKWADFATWVESGDGKDMMDTIIEKLS